MLASGIYSGGKLSLEFAGFGHLHIQVGCPLDEVDVAHRKPHLVCVFRVDLDRLLKQTTGIPEAATLQDLPVGQFLDGHSAPFR